MTPAIHIGWLGCKKSPSRDKGHPPLSNSALVNSRAAITQGVREDIQYPQINNQLQLCECLPVGVSASVSNML